MLDFLKKEDIGIKILIGIGVLWVLKELMGLGFNFGFSF
jgi:hypothetical protein